MFQSWRGRNISSQKAQGKEFYVISVRNRYKFGGLAETLAGIWVWWAALQAMKRIKGLK